ncbi:tautomerase family protein [Streptomyces camelliae]|uniref:Tautomerase family protein n=1 Tax=Streptomyces camelliae TaxID=3004093 RepID=A0ABY7PE95_9ACTN|nr:tautomerase family protein [Streptomyces sp. HUAS 2-6]WBO68949.1 tautomerase family protein [Streptomyces sp. HUAS 2-6]WBO69752.1 tautomerase family protein [Streptomyces sp. HUAS 2-6]
MPVITVDWWQGNDRERRADLVSELAATASRVTGCPIDDVTVIVRDCEPGHASGLRDGRSRTACPGANGFGEMGLGQGSPC